MGKKFESRITNHESQKHLFPVFVKLKDKLCVIVGGGKVARRKAKSLIECGATVNVISPLAEEQIKQWVSEGLLTWCEKKFSAGDLNKACIAFAATDDSEENKKVVEICNRKGIMVNVVDEPELCDFFVPSVIRRKSLAIAISTEGKSPLFAQRLRKELEQILTDEYGEFLDMLGEQREKVKQAEPDREHRKKIFEALVYSEILDLLKAGKRKEAEERIKQCISSLQG
jgi:precorrin-2 dehydrogenase/sirohydrochlorin ferrochelatase